MQRRIFFDINPAVLVIIVVLSAATALVYNYFNPEGLTIISLPEKDEAKTVSGAVKFSQPIEVGSEDAFILYENAVQFIDVRIPEEYGTGHIPNSINLPPQYLDDSDEILSAFADNTPLVVYGGGTSDEDIQLVSEQLFNKGFNKLYVYAAGFDDWSSKKYPVNK